MATCRINKGPRAHGAAEHGAPSVTSSSHTSAASAGGSIATGPSSTIATAAYTAARRIEPAPSAYAPAAAYANPIPASAALQPTAVPAPTLQTDAGGPPRWTLLQPTEAPAAAAGAAPGPSSNDAKSSIAALTASRPALSSAAPAPSIAAPQPSKLATSGLGGMSAAAAYRTQQLPVGCPEAAALPAPAPETRSAALVAAPQSSAFGNLDSVDSLTMPSPVPAGMSLYDTAGRGTCERSWFAAPPADA